MKKKQIIGIVIAAAVFVFVGLSGIAAANSLRSNVSSIIGSSAVDTPMPVGKSIAVVNIAGTIDATKYNALGAPTGTYNHDSVMKLIKDMTDSPNNTGLMLKIDSGGGAVYESDEVYRALMNYKETTGRPVYAYATHTMASGAYYIACAADRIFANRNSTVGSIGVYVQSVNYSGLYEKLGIHGEFIKSGENKAMGNVFDPLTDEQRAIFQSVVDECYNQFIDIVCLSRGYTREQALPICDGRIYTAAQGLEIGIIDDAESSYDDVLEDFKTLCGASEVYERKSASNGLSSLLGSLVNSYTKTETERMLELIENSESGVPMYYAG
ncbi:MAG: signal peptide peptidase SppA [Oscillospiraceae bacterium]